MVDLGDLALWTAGATWVLAVGTLLALYWQTRQAGRLNSANAVITLRERFDSPRMRKARRQTSQHLIKNDLGDITSLEVLTFFELIGAQTARGLLDEEMVWEAFGGWISSYYGAMRSPVDRIQQLRDIARDPLLFHKLEWLDKRIASLDRKQLGSKYVEPLAVAEEDLLYLRREADLEVE
ncbi:MAG: hypothetical protein L3K00_07450 [Thermoplasmata archaeon]|nr:hypothetical protein [Thermoplasmata archaeon]